MTAITMVFHDLDAPEDDGHTHALLLNPPPPVEADAGFSFDRFRERVVQELVTRIQGHGKTMVMAVICTCRSIGNCGTQSQQPTGRPATTQKLHPFERKRSSRSMTSAQATFPELWVTPRFVDEGGNYLCAYCNRWFTMISCKLHPRETRRAQAL